MSSDQLICVQDVTFSWDRKSRVLDIRSFEMTRTERVFLKGPSGSGKSTLLGIVCGVLAPDTGQVEVAGLNLTSATAGQRDAHRSDRLGVIFQLFNLLPFMSLVANVALPCRFSKRREKAACERSGSVEAEAVRLLDRLGLGDPAILKRPVRALSVGQQQRVAAARALIGSPSLVIADEPTSALDADTRNTFVNLLLSEAESVGAGVLFVSHDASLASHFDRSVDLKDINRAFAPVSTGI